jgi:proteasome lid subunit RPN8/RPN11
MHTHSKEDIPVVHNYEIEPENDRKTQRKRYFVQRRERDEHNMVLALNKKHREEIINHSKEVYPLEACGMLVGFRELEKRIVFEVRTSRNVLNSSSSYEVDPEVELQVFIDAEKKSLEVVGMYHSHPHWTATPSSVDADLAFFEDVSYVIYSVSENSMASYVWNGRSFEPEEIEIR